MGALPGFTVTVNVHFAVFWQRSKALQMMVVVPHGKKLFAGQLQEVTTFPESSVAVIGGCGMKAPQRPVGSMQPTTSIFGGQVIWGGVVSLITVTKNLNVPITWLLLMMRH